ncbi:unnamed protein product [Periconia digitata]|uniref:Uncharacterized protein n=1 Tax=Periconia digitata TaxID=1303443 RepID=A0A9W4XW98_9PLEO|nr:unnamed protein product [Periconia digitata]
MSAHRPAYKRKAATLVARQAQTTPASQAQSSFPVPTNRVDLSSAFEGPSTCSQNLLTMLPPPSYQIWINEPVPAANQTIAACYPTEFLTSYTAVMVSEKPSSIVPAMTNFACPKNYCTALASARNYVVCCPSGFQFHPPDSTVDSSRPFYGGTCYSDMTSGSSYPVVRYNTAGDTASTLFPATATDVQAYAHPIDGFAATSPTALGCSPSSKPASSSLQIDTSKDPASSNSASSASSAPFSTVVPPASSGTAPGVIAGAVVGSLLGLAAIVGLIFFALARRRNNGSPPPPPPKHDDSAFGNAGYAHTQQQAVAARHGGNLSEMGADMGSSPSSPQYPGGTFADEKFGGGVYAHRYVGVSELNDGSGVHGGAVEMPAYHPVEMDAGAVKGVGKSEKK